MLKKITRHIPNALTILNLLSGTVGIILTLRFFNAPAACLCLAIAAGFDLCDGLSARLLKAQSNIGKELDSLSDMVSFGLLPAILMYNLMFSISHKLAPIDFIIPFAAIVIPAFAALRLAKFNIEEQNISVFSGLSSPGAAIAIVAIVLNSHTLPIARDMNPILSMTILSCISLTLGILMVSKIPFLSLKFTTFSFKTNYITYIFALVSIILLIIFKLDALIWIVLIYFVLSFIMAPRFVKSNNPTL